MLQSWRGKAAIGKALCLSRYLSPSLAEGVQYSILFEQLSLTLFILFGSGLSGLGNRTYHFYGMPGGVITLEWYILSRNLGIYRTGIFRYDFSIHSGGGHPGSGPC